MVNGISEPYRDLARDELEKFRKLDRIHNHWTRRSSPTAYYWYLTFEDCAELHDLVSKCATLRSQEFYDPTPLQDLHLTIDRLAYFQEDSSRLLAEIEAAATRACSQLQEFELTIGGLGGTATAVGFRAVPDEKTRHLRNVLRRATTSVHPNAPIKDRPLVPHIGIAYCNTDAPASRAIAAVEHLSGIPPVQVNVSRVTLALLERGRRSYSWRTIAHIPLAEKRSK